MRRLLLIPLTACLALVLGGCVVFEVTPSATAPPLGPVVIETTICGSDAKSPFTRGCPNDGNSNLDADEVIVENSNIALQVLLGYRVSAGASAPASFTAGQLIFTRNDGYAAELQRLAPAGAGLQWFGYTSSSFPYDPHEATQVTEVTARAPFGLPRNPDGSPFEGPFRYRAVVGVRTAPSDPTSPVGCGDDLFDFVGFVGVCVDAPAPSQVATSLEEPTSDLGILRGPELTASPGSTVTVPFSARYAGTAPANFAISAGTDLPGATATPNIGSLAPADGSTNPVQVTVTVPADARPGRYAVTLTAALDADRRRSGSATIVIPEPPAPPAPPAPPPPPGPPSIVRIDAPVEVNWEVRGALTKVLRLRPRAVPRGATVQVLCEGRGCPFASRRFKGPTVNVHKHFRKRLRAGATIEVRITAEGAIGKVLRYKMRRGRVPKTTRLCVRPGEQRARKRC